MPRRISFSMNAATDENVGKLHYGANDSKQIHDILVDAALGACDSKRSIHLEDCPSFGTYLDKIVAPVLSQWSHRDQLVFYFSGHGLFQNQTFCLQFGPREADAVPFVNLCNTFKQYGVTRYLLILDACHSGDATAKSTIPGILDSQFQTLPSGTAVIASCKANQISKEHHPQELSVFTYLLIECIQSGLPHQTEAEHLTIDHTLDYIKGRLSDEEFSEYDQSPDRKLLSEEGDLWIARNRHFQSDAQQTGVEESVELNVQWQMPMLQFPIDPLVLQLLSDLLDETRSLVAKRLRKKIGKKFDADSVRANVFFPDHSSAKSGVAYNLFMHNELRSNMNFEPEWNLRLLPGQGVTGKAFMQKKTVLSIRGSDLDGEWHYRFQLTDVQSKSIHPELSWILSIPLYDENTGEPLGVFSVDGLEAVDEKILEDIPVIIAPNVQAFSSMLSTLPKIQVMLGWSE